MIRELTGGEGPCICVGRNAYLFDLDETAAPRSPVALVAAIAALGSSLGLADVFADEVFHRYTFHPGLLANPLRDDELGFLLADLLFVPIMCGSLLLLFPRHRTGLVVAMVALLAGVEVLFVRAGLFFYHGWNVGYSMVAFGTRFAVASWWITHFERVGYTRWFRLLLVSVSLTYAWWLEAMVMSSLSRLWVARLHLHPHPSSDEVLSMFLLVALPFYGVGLTAVLTGWCRSLWRTGLVWAAWSGYLFSLQGAGLWHSSPSWSPIYQGAVAAVIIGGCAQLDRWWQRECPPVQAQRTS